jgi:predicted nuclease of predicted toxin-antitoxin system
MRLLFDQNLAPKLAVRLADLFPASSHVQDASLERGTDIQVWEYAKAGGFAIVTKDDDYNDLSVVRGSPPKVLWLQLGNCTTAQVESLIRSRVSEVEEFEKDPKAGILILNV